MAFNTLSEAGAARALGLDERTFYEVDAYRAAGLAPTYRQAAIALGYIPPTEGDVFQAQRFQAAGIPVGPAGGEGGGGIPTFPLLLLAGAFLLFGGSKPTRRAKRKPVKRKAPARRKRRAPARRARRKTVKRKTAKRAPRKAGGRKVYTAKNGAKYVKMANGRVRFVKRR